MPPHPRTNEWLQEETLVTFEFAAGPLSRPHSLLFVGGLGDGLATTPYAADIVRALQPKAWSFFTLNLTSSYQAWGLGHLDRDTDEIARCARYIRAYKKTKYGHSGKLVLMGHSTGSQCVLHYLHRPNPHTGTPAFDPWLEHTERPALDGAIMQAAVSDREAVAWVLAEGFLGRTPAELREVYDKLVALAREGVREDSKYDAVLPISLTSQLGYARNTPLGGRRFLSLVSPDSPQSPSEDDLFSSDLGDAQLARTFGAIASRGLLKHRLTVLLSGADQSVPDWVDKAKLMARWKKAADGPGGRVWDEKHSGVIPGASHALSNPDQAEPRRLLVEKVLGVLAELEGSD